MFKTTDNRLSRPHIPLESSLEGLEQRALMSGDFAAVGFRFDQASPAVFEMLGHLDSGGGVTGDQVFASLAGAPESGPIDWASLDLLSRGRFNAGVRNGVDPYTEQLGTKFIWDDGYAHGSFAGMFAGGGADVAFLLQRVQQTMEWTSSGHYQYQYLELDSSGYSFLSGVFYFAEDSPNFATWSDSVDGQNLHNIAIESQDEFGSLTLAGGRRLHVSPNYYTRRFDGTTPVYPPGDTVLIVDTDASDGKVGIGLARRFQDDTIFGSENFVGTYRSTIITSGALGDAFFGASDLAGGPGLAQAAIELSQTGDYRIYDLAGYDAGDRTVIGSGTWECTNDYVGTRRSFVILTSQTGAKARLMVGFDFNLTAYTVENADASVVEPLLGGLSTFTGLDAQRFIRGGHVGLDDNGHPIFYSNAADGPGAGASQNWYAEDLLENWGGAPLVAVESKIVPASSPTHVVMGVSVDGDVLIWNQVYGGRWQFRNLTQELGAEQIVSDVTIFDFRDRTVFPWLAVDAVAIAGKNAEGDLILYTPGSERSDYGAYPWTSVNITDDLMTPFGEDTPAWTGAVQGYQTPWGGMNVVGVDASGDLVVAWTAPGLDQWRTTNISDLAGTPAMTGGLSVLLTDWSGIHIHALDDQGKVHVTWWVPQFGGEWEHNTLSDDAGGPLFDPSRTTARTEAFTTFVGLGNTLNIIGFDEDGHARIYWWSPATDVWNIGDLSNSFPVEDAPVGFAAADFLGGMDPNGPYNDVGQSLYGYNADGTYSRVWWAPGGPDQWHVENLTQQAIAVET